MGRPVVLVLMGVSGCGKSTVAALLAGRLGWRFLEGDDLHPPENVEKMASGQPLTDEDRSSWLDNIADWIGSRLDAGEDGVVTCSALKRAYRDRLDRRRHGVQFVYLAGSYDTIAGRLAARQGHYMPAGLLRSQFDALEEPSTDEPAIQVDISGSATAIADEVTARLALDR